MRDAEVHESRLLAAAHDLDRVPERILRGAEEATAILQLAQRARPDGANGLPRHEPEALPESMQALERALAHFGMQHPVRRQSFRERNPFAQPIEQVQMAVHVLGHHHVEAVRPEVDGGDGLDGFRGHVVPHCRDSGARPKRSS